MLKRAVDYVSPDTTAFLAGAGTLVSIAAWGGGYVAFHHVPVFSFDRVGVLVGLLKGILLACLMLTHQRLIGRSLSVTIYAFPIAVGLIAVIEARCFDTSLSPGAIGAIGILFVSGLAFCHYGHLSTMTLTDKRRFAQLILLIVAFGVCDKIGIPKIGWPSYLLFTGVGTIAVTWPARYRLADQSVRTALFIGGVWALPELFFNYALQAWLPVAYGYLAIALRVPVLMVISARTYGEGKMQEQLVFGLMAMVGVAMLFVR